MWGCLHCSRRAFIPWEKAGGPMGSCSSAVLADSPGQDGMYPTRLARLLLMGSSLANARGTLRQASSLCLPTH